jgi:DNA repair exonuclease SbcCD nuclease subunit
MKISYCSDLHLEFDFDFACLELKNIHEADTLVLAGDIFVANRWFTRNDRFLENVCKEFKDVVYVMGNHEHYSGDFKRTPSLLKEQFFPFANFHFLNNEWWEKDGVRFFGSTLWTDMNKRDPYVLSYVSRCMNDFRLVKNGDVLFTTADAAREHSKALASLQFALSDHNPDNKFVVVGHHAPSPRSIHPRYAGESEMNYGYHSNLEDFIKEYPQINLWFHGHTHTNFDYQIGETRVACNPRGYVGEEMQAEKFNLRTIEV